MCPYVLLVFSVPGVGSVEFLDWEAPAVARVEPVSPVAVPQSYLRHILGRGFTPVLLSWTF